MRQKCFTERFICRNYHVSKLEGQDEVRWSKDPQRTKSRGWGTWLGKVRRWHCPPYKEANIREEQKESLSRIRSLLTFGSLPSFCPHWPSRPWRKKLGGGSPSHGSRSIFLLLFSEPNTNPLLSPALTPLCWLVVSAWVDRLTLGGSILLGCMGWKLKSRVSWQIFWIMSLTRQHFNACLSLRWHTKKQTNSTYDVGHMTWVIWRSVPTSQDVLVNILWQRVLLCSHV